MAEQMRQGDDASDQVLAAIFGQTRLEAHAGMTSDGHLTAYATPWARQFRDDIESLRHVDEGDERVSDTGGDMRTLFSELTERFVELDVEITGANYWIPTTGSSGDGEQQRRGGGG